MDIELGQISNDSFEVKTSHFKLDRPKGILIVYPGAGYNYMGPYLYYISNMLMDKGYEVLNLEYDFRQNRQGLNVQNDYENFYRFIQENVKKLNLPSEKIALCKSIGTRIVGSSNCSDYDKYIWLTPALKDEYVFKNIQRLKNKSLVVIGSKDPFYDENLIAQLESSEVQLKVLHGADHGLDLDSNTLSSVDLLKESLYSVSSFV